MTSKLLFRNFSLCASAPNGVANLRNLVLNLAVSGKLALQDPNDEPTATLAEQIRAEQAQLAKKGIIQKQRSYGQISPDEYPYQLPENWRWFRLADVAHNLGQKEPDKRFTYIDVTSIDKERGRISDAVKILEPEQAPSRARKVVAKGSVIYSTVRPYLLNIAVVDQDFKPDPIVSTAFAVLHPYSVISNKYLYYYLRSKPFIDYVEAEMAGIAYPAINETRFYRGLVPIPPFHEQHRIVANVDLLMSLCNELEARQQQEKLALKRLGTAALTALENATNAADFSRFWSLVHQNFDSLFDCKENITTLRETILKLAMRGKLVPQDSLEEPVKTLLESSHHKRKRVQKDLAEAKELAVSDLPKLPQGWVWASYSDFGEWRGGGTPSKSNILYWDNGQIPWVTPKDMKTPEILDSIDKITEEGLNNSAASIVPKESLLFVVRSGILRRLLPVAINKVDVTVNQDLKALVLSGNVEPKYLLYVTKAFDDDIRTSCAKTGTTVESIEFPKLQQYPIPLPPIGEQRRIIAKIDKLMTLCDELEGIIQQSQEITASFANSITKAVFTFS